MKKRRKSKQKEKKNQVYHLLNTRIRTANITLRNTIYTHHTMHIQAHTQQTPHIQHIPHTTHTPIKSVIPVKTDTLKTTEMA